MFNKFKSGATQVKRAALEKAGKVQSTEESEEFHQKLTSLDATKQTFVNLQKVGKSIYTQNRHAIEKKKSDEVPETSPADDFLKEINVCLKLKTEYVRSRRAMDDAKACRAKAEEAAKVPSKNQEAKNTKANLEKENERAKINEYNAAKQSLLQKVAEIEGQRDAKFEETITGMCSILQNMTPDWNTDGGSSSYMADENKGESLLNSGSSQSFAPPVQSLDSQVQTFAPPSSGDATGAVAVLDTTNTRQATDSESD